LWRGLAEAFLDTPLRDEFTARIRRTYRGHARALFLSGASISDRCQLALHLAHQLVRLLPPMRWLRVDRAAFWVPAAVGYWLSQRRQRRHAGVTPDAGQPLNAVLVTRAMGGIGDLLTMTPGLRALRRKHPGTEIHFAIPRQFFPVFEGNDDFTCIDIESATLDPNRYRAWFDLTDCPASRVESRQAPNVRIGRIELFARAMGLSAAAVRGEGARPRYLISIAEQLVAEQTAVAMQLRGRPLVGLQWAAAETYRNYPHNSELVRLLARRCNVLILGAPVPSECAIDGVHSVMAPLRQGFALASLCDVLIGPDSSFLHLAGALAKPMLMLAGPVDGQLRARDYPTVEALMPDRREFPCAPCWRNEAINCYLSGRRESVCLRSIAPAAVAERVFALLPRSLLKDVGEDDQKIQPSAIGTAAPAT
jgi:ADP-heptose:LPS heptosyltransferase